MKDLPNCEHLYPIEVAQFLRVNVRTIYDLIAEAGLPAIKIGRQFRIPRQEFLEWREKNRERSALSRI